MVNDRITKAAIIVKPDESEPMATATELTDWLADRGITLVTPPIEAGRDDSRADAIADAHIVIVLGGDGTMIAAARLIGDTDVAVMGVNYGSLGYLTDFRIEEMFAGLGSVLSGDFKLDRRVMLRAELWRGDELHATGRVLNDVVINKAALARIIDIEVDLDRSYVNTFRADGLIISTPTGSTAYNLSAGGPIVYPSMNAVVLTPICPFTLTNRPIVIPDDSLIELRLLTENEGVVLSLDGQTGFAVRTNDIIKIRKSETMLNLVQPATRNYFDVLRDKLRWGR